MTTVPAGDHYYYNQYSPPVSPKSIPHGYKRKASTQEDDELETNSAISHSLKKLRLNSKRATVQLTQDFVPVGLSYRDVSPSEASLSARSVQQSRHNSYVHSDRSNGDDFMPVDETSDRVWVHDLDAEVAEIEAEEARQKYDNGICFAGQTEDYIKLPDHLLRPSTTANDPVANMQMILYRDPISISVPEEDDAVRKTILDARRRVREKLAEEREFATITAQHLAPVPRPNVEHYDEPENQGNDDEMDLD
ncbi:hypothetical protein LTR05_005411 [Lithohypha guttulata]|uniref:Uncharacterized protein n=1 Tax=Lithohypha guttulata TaxID=1690604 RepID=A0AAN7SXQ5_9EURO|nr:hypothetical protein LTR05_005411 [Lithohypha guttulata]